MVEYELRLDQARALDGWLMPAQQSKRSESESIHRLQNRQMAGVANGATVVRVITGMRFVEGSGLGERRPDQQQDQDRVPGAAPQCHRFRL